MHLNGKCGEGPGECHRHSQIIATTSNVHKYELFSADVKSCIEET